MMTSEVKIIFNVDAEIERIQNIIYRQRYNPRSCFEKEMRQFEGAWSSDNQIEAEKLDLNDWVILNKLRLKQSQ